MITMAAVNGVALTLLTFVGNITAFVLRAGKQDSLASFTKSTRVEPIALVDRALIHQPWMQDVMFVANSVFTGYYLQAIALTSTAINGVSALKVLDRLSPTRDVSDNTATLIEGSVGDKWSNSLLSFESYRYGLPVPGQAVGLEAHFSQEAINPYASWQAKHQKPSVTQTAVATANAVNQQQSATRHSEKLQGFEDAWEASETKELKTNSVNENKAYARVEEAVNLSVGRIFEVSLQQGTTIVKVPVSVRLITTVIDTGVLAHILSGGGQNKSLKERYHAWRAGQLHFVRDIILMQDLIDQHRNVLKKDDSGIYAEIMERRRGNQMSSAMSGKLSIGSASNIVVMSKRTAAAAEAGGKGRFSDMKFRERVFESTYLLLIFVIDEEMERVTIYHRDIALPTQLSLKELKSANKNGGPDVMEILKAYTLGSPARL